MSGLSGCVKIHGTELTKEKAVVRKTDVSL